jgi:hypothetical protein
VLADDAARSTAEAVVGLPSLFMLDGATYAHGTGLGFEGVDFYFAGRGGLLGDVAGEVVAAALVFFNPATVVAAWDRSRPVMPRRQAVAAFAGCLPTWAAGHLAEGVDYGRLAALAGRVVGGASPAAAPLFAGWRALPEPGEPKALALHRLNALRELRGALHEAAVIAAGLEPLEAVLIRTPQMAGLFGWPEPHPEVAARRPLWEQAEAATNRLLGRVYGVLDDGELPEFVDLVGQAHAAVT